MYCTPSNSIINTFPNAFSELTTVEITDFQLLAKTLSSLNSFFENRSDDSDEPSRWEICLRCLEECKSFPTDNAAFESVMMSCGQNVQAAHRTIINDQIRTLSNEMNEWVSTCRDAVVSDNLTTFHTDHADDPRRIDWANRMKSRIHQSAVAYTTQTAIDEVIEPWASEALEGARARAINDNVTKM